jgi:G3E family GTPase
MVKALEALVQQRDRFDHLLIESTGLADPGPVAAALWTDPELEAAVRLDAVVTVADARNLLRQLAEPRPRGAPAEAQLQLAHADVVLLNKCDLVGEDAVVAAEQAVAEVNAEAEVVRCVRCEVDLGAVLGRGAYVGAPGGVEAALRAAPAADRPAISKDHCFTVKADEEEPHHNHDHDHVCEDEACPHPSHSNRDHYHRHSGVTTVTLRAQAPMDMDSLRKWMDHVLWEKPQPTEIERYSQGNNVGEHETNGEGETGEEIIGEGTEPATVVYRVKALLHVAGEDSRWVLQAVHDLYDVVEGPAWTAEEVRGSKVVFIGRGLSREVLSQGLEACVVEGMQDNHDL